MSKPNEKMWSAKHDRETRMTTDNWTASCSAKINEDVTQRRQSGLISGVVEDPGPKHFRFSQANFQLTFLVIDTKFPLSSDNDIFIHKFLVFFGKVTKNNISRPPETLIPPRIDAYDVTLPSVTLNTAAHICQKSHTPCDGWLLKRCTASFLFNVRQSRMTANTRRQIRFSSQTIFGTASGGRVSEERYKVGPPAMVEARSAPLPVNDTSVNNKPSDYRRSFWGVSHESQNL